MAVVELSRTISTMSVSLYTAFTTPVIPEAKNVESPINEKCTLSGSTLCSPWAIVTSAPMQRHVSVISSGFAFPRV